MFDKKFDILSCSIEQDQNTVANQWAKTFIHNSKDDHAVIMTQFLLACLACGDFRVRPFLSKSSVLQAPSDQLNIVDYLSHASRIILDYQELTGAHKEELLKYFPAPGVDNTIFARSATHNVHRSMGGEIVEGKGFLLGLMGQLPGIIKTPQDFGINIAMGGEGQENFYGKKISANGYSGHFYFHRNDSDSLLMLGLEQSAPAASALELVWGAKKYPNEVQQHHDQFDQGHSLKGASDTYTAAGSLYFSDPVYQAKLLVEKGVFPPDKYGAMQVKITYENWPYIKNFLDKLRIQSNDVNKGQLLELLLTKPSTATSTKDEYLSYIALDFDSYLKRIYQIFISEGELDVESQSIFLDLQSNLLATIKKLQQGHIDSYEIFNRQIAEIIKIENIPPEYQKAILRIQQLFELQLKIDPKLNQTHQELLLKNQYDDLQEESKDILEKLLSIQKHFLEHPPTEDQRELQVFLQQIDIQIKALQNPFAPLSEELIDLSSSWVMCDAPVSINMDSIDKLRQTIERAKALTNPGILTSINFWELVHQFKENTDLKTKEKLLREMQLVSEECSSIFGAAEAIKEARTEFTKLQEFLLQLQDLAKKEDKFAAVKSLDQQYEKLPENERKQYESQLFKAKLEAFCQIYLEKINASKTIDERKEKFHLFSQFLNMMPVDLQGKFKVALEVKQKENALFELHDNLEKASSVKAKQQLFNNELFSATIKNFEIVRSELTSEFAKRVHKQLTRAKVIYEKLHDAEVIAQESLSKPVDTLLNQLEPVLDAIEDSLQSQLLETALQDEVFKETILKKVNLKEFSSVLIKDLLTLKDFRDQKIALSEEKKYGSKYDQSINRFYKIALDIRLSDKPIKQQAEEIINSAHIEFNQRHDGFRLAADVAMIVSAIFGVGILVGVGRLALGKTLFFSSYLNDIKTKALGETFISSYLDDLKTDREEELKNEWLAQELPENGQNVQLLTAPAA